MNVKRNKKSLLLLTSTAIVAGFTVFVLSANMSGDLTRARGLSGIVVGSVSWDASSSKTVHSSNRVSYSYKTSSGTDIYLYSVGQYDVTDDYIFASKKSDYLTQGLFVTSTKGSFESMFSFQSVTSVTIVADSSSEEGAGFGVIASSNLESTPVYTNTASGSSDDTFVITTEVAGAHYIGIKATNLKEIHIKSVSVSYSCDPSDPGVETRSISYFGFEDWEKKELEGVVLSSLIYDAEPGSHVEITPVFLPSYAYYASFEYTEHITDYEYSAGVISFTMPDNDVEIVIMVESISVELESIAVSGAYKTNFTVGDEFTFGGTVIATYTDTSEVDVTGDAEFDDYDMYTVGEQTVTVSYTDGMTTKTTTYDIVVSSESTDKVVLTGTYNYVSRKKYSTPDWSLHNMTITFYNDGTCMWRNVRTNSLSNVFDCKVYFTYEATDNGANITIAMAHTTYDFTKDGAYNNQASSFSGGGYDRPINGGFGNASSRNDSGVLSSDKSTLTICTYDQSHSYEVYDTFTFTLAA